MEWLCKTIKMKYLKGKSEALIGFETQMNGRDLLTWTESNLSDINNNWLMPYLFRLHFATGNNQLHSYFIIYALFPFVCDCAVSL